MRYLGGIFKPIFCYREKGLILGHFWSDFGPNFGGRRSDSTIGSTAAQKILVKVKKKLVNHDTVVEYTQGQSKKYVYE